MRLLQRIPFFLLLIYPLLGHISIKYLNIPPYYILSAFTVLALIGISASRIKITAYQVFMILYLLFVIISIYVAHDNPLRVDSNLGQIIYILLPIALLVIIENTSFTNFNVKWYLRLMFIIVISAVIITFVQYFEPSFFLYTDIYTNYDPNTAGYARRIMSIFSWGDFNASRYIAIGLVCFYGILLNEYERNTLITIILLSAVGMIVLLSQFRIAMLTYIITTISILSIRRNFQSIVYFAIPIISIYLLIIILNYDMDYFVDNRIKSESALSRIEAFRVFFIAFPENPYFGTGGERTQTLFDAFGETAKLHNAHLAIAYYYGIFASISHTIFIILLGIRTFKTGKILKYWSPFIGVMCYLLATMTFPSGHFLIPGLILLLVFEKYYRDLSRYNYFIELQAPPRTANY